LLFVLNTVLLIISILFYGEDPYIYLIMHCTHL